jgi:diketogulonate reductase-like aldo/keto reductase
VPHIYVGLWQAGSRLWRSTDISLIESAVRRGVELGLNRFDTAEIYGWGRSERLVGKLVSESVDLYVVSKVAGFRWTVNDISKAAKKIKERIGRSVDLLLAHWPPPVYASICRVVRGLEKAVEAGYTNRIGVSNYPAHLLEEAMHCTSKYELSAVQIQYSLAYRTPENTLIPLARKLGLEVMAWSPLAKGALTGELKKGEPARSTYPVYKTAVKDSSLLKTLREVASELGLTPAQVAVLWVKSRGASPVVGVRRPRHVEELSRIKDSILPDWAAGRLDLASQKYVTWWGKCYSPLQKLRWILGVLQKASIYIAGGV